MPATRSLSGLNKTNRLEDSKDEDVTVGVGVTKLTDFHIDK